MAKLDSTGSALVYSTLLGGGGDDAGSGIAVDASGNAYVTGTTNSTDFPTTPGSIQPTYARGDSDVFVTKLQPTGSLLVYSTFLGGGFRDSGTGIAVDPAGNAYVTGATASINFPTTAEAFQPANGGPDRFGNPSMDAFVAKITYTTTRFEENAASYTGYWPTYGAETGTFSGGTIRASNQATATASFTFTGTAVSWVGVKCNVRGIATVQIDGGAPTVVDTFGPGEPGSLSSEPVFTASGLAPDVMHTLTIIVTGGGVAAPDFLTGSAHVAVDAFDVTR